MLITKSKDLNKKFLLNRSVAHGEISIICKIVQISLVILSKLLLQVSRYFRAVNWERNSGK